MTRFLRLLGLFTLTLLFSCQRELSFKGGSGSSDITPTPDPITAVLQGNVLDENGQPTTGATVTVGNQTATTDTRGYFRIMAASLDKKASLVTVEKTGYFKAYRTFAATSGANQVVVKLVKRNLAGTIDAAAGGEASLANGSKVALPANGVVVASSNAPYTGTVKVYAAYIDPSADDIAQTVPGSFQANDKDGKRVILTSYGMLAVELEGASGEKLQIRSGSEATLTTAIPAGRQAAAPATLPLWYVDEQSGLWKEEGTATKSGNVYVGKVKHFTYWNCDYQGPTVMITLTVKTSDGAPVPYTYVSFSTPNGWGCAHGITDSLGQVSGAVPANVPLQMQVSGYCGNAIYQQSVGALSASTNLGVITVPAAAMVVIKGNLTNCSSAPVTNGYALVRYGWIVGYAAADGNGNFSISFPYCSGFANTVNVLGIDAATNQQSQLATQNTTAPVTNFGTVNACGTSASEYLNYTLDGNNISYNGAIDSVTASSGQQGTTGNAYIGGSRMVPYSSLYLTSTANGTGTFPVQYISASNLGQTTVITPFNITYTNWPTAIGQFYEGSFSGSFKDAANVTHTVTNGTFRIRKLW